MEIDERQADAAMSNWFKAPNLPRDLLLFINCIKLARNEDKISPEAMFRLQRGGGRRSSSTTLSVAKIGASDGVVIEGSFQGGVKKEVLRSMCQVANETGMDLEVCLVSSEDDWFEVASHSSHFSRSSQRFSRPSASSSQQNPVRASSHFQV